MAFKRVQKVWKFASVFYISDVTPDTNAQGLPCQDSQPCRQNGTLQSWTACGD